MSARERDRRAQLAQLAHGAGLFRGTLAIRERVCGKPNRKCTKGEKHVSLYLVASYKGRPRQLFIPKDFEPQVRRWVQQYQEARKLLEEVSLPVIDAAARAASREPFIRRAKTAFSITIAT